jgi:chaperonin GroEL
MVLSTLESSKDPNFGYDAKSFEYKDLKEAGIIDPTMVVTQAVKNAVSAANMIILSDTAMVNLERTPPYTPPSPDYVQ